jgi:subfamily B ATP-binding cassette protein HlyB/CyaB
MGRVTMLFITHALPRSLQVDEVVRIGCGPLSAVSAAQDMRAAQEKNEAGI